MSAVIRQMVARKRTIAADAEAFSERSAQIIAEAKGERGEPGPKGDKPAHEWKGTKLRFEQPDGTWGKFVDIKGKDGKDGKDGRQQVVVGGYVSSAPNLSSLAPGAEGVTPASIAVQQGSEWVSLPWDAFIPIIAGAIDMSATASRRTDFVGTSLLYRGEAEPGAAESAAVWRIKRIEFLPDGDVIEKWAAGSAEFSHQWTDRETLVYS